MEEGKEMVLCTSDVLRTGVAGSGDTVEATRHRLRRQSVLLIALHSSHRLFGMGVGSGKLCVVR